MFIADGTYRIERGSAEPNRFGDEVDVASVVVSRVPGAVSNKRRMRSEGGTMLTVLVTTGRFRPGTDVQQGDRVVCEQDATRAYIVDDVPDQPGASIMHGDRVVELKRIAQ
jgi:hypothetical protein